jgi:peptidoglycan/LPS O-acetylase OafA/YrhL
VTRSGDHGDVIVRADLLGTALFVATAVFAAVSFSTAAQWIGAITAMSLFVIGVAAFGWAFYNAVQRSRGEQISVTQLFFLLGSVAPPRVRRIMLSLLLVQFVTALLTTLARPNGPDGSPGSSLAVGFLVSMFGFGLNGLWAAFHGRYEIRDDAEPTRRASIGKNDDHG